MGFSIRTSVAFSTELWGDESVSVYLSTRILITDLIFQFGQYYDSVHPSGYYLVLKIWNLAGFYEDWWFRSLSLMFFFPTTLGLYLLSKQLGSTRYSAVLSVLIFSINPILISMGYQVRMYALVLLLIVWGFYFFTKNEDSSKNILITSILFSFAIYVDYLTLWILLSLFCYSLYEFILLNKKPIKIFRVLLLSLFLSLPQLFILISNYFKLGQLVPTSIPLPITVNYLQDQTSLLFGIAFEEGLLFYLTFVFILAIYLYQLKLGQMQLLIITSLTMLIISFVATQLFTPIYIARNLSLISLFSCIIISEAFVTSIKKIISF